MQSKSKQPGICDNCGDAIRARSRSAIAAQKFCSHKCFCEARRRQHMATVLANFEQHGECALWLGYVNEDGYGVTTIGGRPALVHRLIYEAQIGPIPDGLFVCHTCDVRRCGKREHLFVGTHSDNMADMVAKGRAFSGHPAPERNRGTSNPNGKLTPEDVRAIRDAVRLGVETQVAIGARYGVSKHTVYDIARRSKTWRWLDADS
jgi:HNH endonuclease